jgi:hypothetical protein
MVVELAPNLHVQVSYRMSVRFFPDISEIMAFCPGCKTLETLRVNSDSLIQTSKFNQQDDQVFHGCGTPVPCRLYRT